MIYMVLYVLLWHFIGDFVFQTHEMAINKSKSNIWLSTHILIYGNWLLFGSLPILFFHIELTPWITLFVIINMGLHWITDYFTSRLASKLWKQQKMHEFFVVIGLDGLIHQITLILSLEIIYNFI